MTKLLAFVLAFSGLVVNQATPTLTVKISGVEKEIMGVVVGGKDMVPLVDFTKLLEAQLDIKKITPTDRLATVTLAPPKPPFDDGNDTVLPVDGDTAAWVTVAGSEGKLRVRDFTRVKDSWHMIGEIDVAKNAITVQDRPPRQAMSLTFYVVYKDANGKTLGRRNIQITGVAFEGGRYPISINLSRGDGSTALPATVGIRFNAALEEERGGL